MGSEDSVVLCSPPDEVEAQTLLSLLAQRGIAARLEPRAVSGYPTVLGRADVIRVRRGDLARAQTLLDRWQRAAREDGDAMEQLAEQAGDRDPDARAARLTSEQRELFRRHGPVSWEHAAPWIPIAVGLFGVLEALWDGSATRQPTVFVLWLGCIAVGVALAHPSAGLRDAPLRRALTTLWSLEGAARAGNCARVLALCDELRTRLPITACPYLFVNALVNHLITCGRYRDALAAPEAWNEAARELGAEIDPEHALLTQLNQVEALYNQGHLGEARALLVEVPTASGFAVVEAGLVLQHGWLDVLKGDGPAALTRLASVDDADVPHEYRAELWLARARARLLTGEPTAAQAAAETGLSLAVRAPSERNALFVLAEVARAAGELERAAELYAEGAEHDYRGQGGDALLAWGDTEQALGRPQRARAAWALVPERDPESPAAARALEHLAA